MRGVAVLGVLVVAAGSALLLGCPATGVVCAEGTAPCGTGCADFTSDRRNCGGCGLACQQGQLCQDSQCVCGTGTELCGGKCVVLATDPQHCGACGKACASGQVCEVGADGGASSCKAACELGTSSVCGGACVNVQTDPNHCGGCGTVCEDGRECHGGSCTFPLVLACKNFGQVRGLRPTDAGVFTGPLSPLGTTPQSIAVYRDVLLSLDDTDRLLLQASLATFARLGDGGTATGTAPNQVLVHAERVLVVNSLSNTLQILDVDGGQAKNPSGIALATAGEVNFGANTNPIGVAVLGDTAWVSLMGGNGAGAAAGQKLATVALSNPSSFGTVDLAGLDLKPFDGGTALARPFSVSVFGGKVYAALNNFDESWSPAGPGMLAEVEPADGGVQAIDLGADKCLNAVSLAGEGDDLYVGCAGKVLYDANWVTTGVEKGGVLLLRRPSPGAPLQVVSHWAAACATGTSCTPPQVGRIALDGKRLYATDQAAGRVWVLENVGNTLQLVAEVQACALPDGSHWASNVTELIVVR